jgi:hypothetical protein
MVLDAELFVSSSCLGFAIPKIKGLEKSVKSCENFGNENPESPLDHLAHLILSNRKSPVVLLRSQVLSRLSPTSLEFAVPGTGLRQCQTQTS